MDESVKNIRILVIDDDDLIRGFISNLADDFGWMVDEAQDGLQGVEMVRNNVYDLALLDLSMPGPSGLEVLPDLLKYGLDMAVIMMSGFAEVGSAVEAMKKGAYDFLQKPIESEVLATRIEKTLELRTLRIEYRQYVTDIEKRVTERTGELEAARKATIFGLARLAEYRDEETGYHLERMATYGVTLTRALRGMGLYRDILTDNYLSMLFESAPLHDIGKVGIPDSILRKPDKLTAEEFEVMKTHTILGARAIEDIQAQVKGQCFLVIGMELARCHHEHFDGRGYPERLKGYAIPLSARILAVADFYDALAFPRIYRPTSLPHAEVKEMLVARKGAQFDPDVVDGFLQCENEIVAIRDRYAE